MWNEESELVLTEDATKTNIHDKNNEQNWKLRAATLVCGPGQTSDDIRSAIKGWVVGKFLVIVEDTLDWKLKFW